MIILKLQLKNLIKPNKMKVKLLRKLRKGFKLIYYPATSVSREHWTVFYPSNNADRYTYFTFQEALDSYLMRTHNYLSNYIQDSKSKQIF